MGAPFNVACSLCAGVFATAIGLWTITGRRRRDAINLCFGWMCLMVALGAMLACVFWMFEAEMSVGALVIAALEYVACTMFSVALAGYAWFTIARWGVPSRRLMPVLVSYALCEALLLWAVALVRPQRPDHVAMGVAGVCAGLAVYALVALSARRSMGGVPRGERLLVTAFLAFPVAASAMQLFVRLLAPGVSVFFLILTGSMLTVLMGVQSHRELAYSRRKAELMQMRKRTVLSQIQPHFLYNTLAAIRALCRSDPSLATTMVADFSDYLKVNMASLVETRPISFEDELRHVRKYLDIEALRMGDRLHVVYDLPVRDFSLPALTVQTLVENAVRHGVSKRPEGGTVRISTREDPDRYVVAVEDDGVGFDVSAPLDSSREHVGVASARLRLSRMCAGTLGLESAVGVGTRATVLLPKARDGR